MVCDMWLIPYWDCGFDAQEYSINTKTMDLKAFVYILESKIIYEK